MLKIVPLYSQLGVNMILEFEKSIPWKNCTDSYKYKFVFNKIEDDETYNFDLSITEKVYKPKFKDKAKPYELLLAFLVDKLQNDGLKNCYDRYREFSLNDDKQIIFDEKMLVHLKQREKIRVKD